MSTGHMIVNIQNACPSLSEISIALCINQQVHKLCIISDKSCIFMSSQCAKCYFKDLNIIYMFLCTIKIIFYHITMFIKGAHEVQDSQQNVCYNQTRPKMVTSLQENWSFADAICPPPDEGVLPVPVEK